MAHRSNSPRVGITYGPTRAWIDPVRYIANASTGALGALIADKFASSGARVDAIVGPNAVPPKSDRIAVHSIESPAQLEATLRSLSRSHTEDPFRLWIHAMAVLDFVPESTLPDKLSSNEHGIQLRLVPTPKMIDMFQTLFPESLLVGFKLLAGDNLGDLKLAAETLGRRARCGLVVANFQPFGDPGAHQAYFWDRRKDHWFGPRNGKPEIAEEIFRWFTGIL
jgi:phosphopantothenoylcysteine synthetase/decarboxylase